MQMPWCRRWCKDINTDGPVAEFSIRSEAIATRLEAIASIRLEAIATWVEAIANGPVAEFLQCFVVQKWNILVRQLDVDILYLDRLYRRAHELNQPRLVQLI